MKILLISYFGLCSHFVLSELYTTTQGYGKDLTVGLQMESLLDNFWLNIELPSSDCNMNQYNDIIKHITKEESLKPNITSFLKINVVLVYLVINLDTVCKSYSSSCGPLINSTYSCFRDQLLKLLVSRNLNNTSLFSKHIRQAVKSNQNFELPDVSGITNEEQLEKLCAEIIYTMLQANQITKVSSKLIEPRHDHSEYRHELENYIITEYGTNGTLTIGDLQHLLKDLKIGSYQHSHEHHSESDHDEKVNVHSHKDKTEHVHDVESHYHDDHSEHTHEVDNLEHAHDEDHIIDVVFNNTHIHESHPVYTYDVAANNTNIDKDQEEHIHDPEINITHIPIDQPGHIHDSEVNNTHIHITQPEHIHDLEVNNTYIHIDQPEHIQDPEVNNTHNHIDQPEHIQDPEVNNTFTHKDQPEHIIYPQVNDTHIHIDQLENIHVEVNNTKIHEDIPENKHDIQINNTHIPQDQPEHTYDEEVNNTHTVNSQHEFANNTEVNETVTPKFNSELNKTHTFAKAVNNTQHIDRTVNIFDNEKVIENTHNHDEGFNGINRHDLDNNTETHGIHTRLRRHADDGHPKCLKAADLFHLYGLNENQTIDQNQLVQLCPIILQQIVNESCRHEPHKVIVLSDLEKYGFGTLSVVIISISSLLGIALVPLMSSFMYDIFLMGFIALGVGTLAGDAILHLIPQCLGLHTHKDNEPDHDQTHDGFPAYIWVALTVLGAIYILFLLETLMQLAMHSTKNTKEDHSHSDSHGHSHVPDIKSFHPKNSRKYSKVNGNMNNAFGEDKYTPKEELTTSSLKQSPEIELSVIDVNSSMNLHKSEEDNIKIRSTTIGKGLTTLALVIILGDAIHNVADGLAIGAAFSVGTNDGISVSIAILCHEIPHELADFAILLSTGMSYKKALACNLIGALTAFIGLYIGLYLGDDEYSRQWVFAVAAGMFLYVALGDLMMELIHPKNGFKWSVFLIENIGMLIGIGIMLVIALYEDKISIR